MLRVYEGGPPDIGEADEGKAVYEILCTEQYGYHLISVKAE